MGRLTKEMKKAELMEQLTEANEAYLEKISQHMECQYREMQRVERRIERKKKLIDKKYMVSIKKLAKERKEKLKKIVGRYRRIEEKVREATIDKVDLAEIENIEKEYITLRQFLLNILRERETGKLPNWKERITERSVESEISTDGGAVVSKLRALQYEFTSKFNFVMGQMPDSDVPAYSYLSRGGYIYLTEQNCEFFKLFMGNDEDCEYIEYDIIGCIKSKKVEELDERVKDQIKEGMYSRHPDWEIVEVYVDQGITGTQAQKRPEFLRMMEDAQKGKFDLIITREVSRFARNTVDTLSYTRELKARGVDVFFINDGINTATNDGELRLTIMSSMAQDESRKISERVKAGQKVSREKHVLYGSGNILGYRRENGTYVPDPDQAETVRLIFQMYSTGENGLVKIVNELYRLGRLDAGGHVSWDASKVSRVLHNATYKGCICYNKSHSDGYLTQKRVKNLDESSYIYVKGDFEPLVSEEMWDRCQQILASKSARVIDENGKKHKYMRNTPKSVWTAKLRCSCGAGFIQFKWRVNRDGAVVHGFQCYRRTRRPSISYLQEHGLDLGISCQIKAICEWKLDLMAAKVFEHLTFDKGKTVKEVYKILNRCMAEEKTVRISRKAMLENSIARQRERLDKYIDLCADGIITKQELAERRKGLDAQIAELQSQYENVEQEDERSGTIDMNLIAQKLDEWQKASRNDVNRELINSCVAQITPLTNEEYRWVLDFQLTEVQSGNSATCTLDGFMEMARFTISFEEAKAFKASRNQGIRKNEWHDLTVAVGIRTKT